MRSKSFSKVLGLGPRALFVSLTVLALVSSYSCQVGSGGGSEPRESSAAPQTMTITEGQNSSPTANSPVISAADSGQTSKMAYTRDYPPLPSTIDPMEFKAAVIRRISPVEKEKDGADYYLHPKFRVPDYTKRLRAGEFTIQDLRTMFGFDQVRFYAIEPEKKPITLPVAGNKTIYTQNEVKSINQELCGNDDSLETLMASISDNAAIALKYIDYIFLYYLSVGHQPPRSLREIEQLNLLPVKLTPQERSEVQKVLNNCGASYSQIVLLAEGVIASNLYFNQTPSFEDATDYVRYRIYAQLPTWGGFGVMGHPDLLKDFHEKFVAPYQGTGKLYPRDNMQRLKEWMRSHPTLTINEEFFRLAEQTPWAQEDEWD